jgi:hypothetical protein
MVEDWKSKPLSRPFGIPSSRDGSVKNNESEILLLKRRIRELEEQFHGLVASSTLTTVSIATAGTYVDLAVTGTLGEAKGVGLVTGKFGLKNISRKPYFVDVTATADFEAKGSNKVLGLRIVKNGQSLSGAECRATVANNFIAKLHSFGIVRVDPDDELTVQVANFTNTNDPDFQRGRMKWVRLPGV